MTLVSNLKNKIQEQTNLHVLYYDNDKGAFISTAPLKTRVAEKKGKQTIKQAASKEYFSKC